MPKAKKLKPASKPASAKKRPSKASSRSATATIAASGSMTPTSSAEPSAAPSGSKTAKPEKPRTDSAAEKRNPGRPSTFSQAVADRICGLIATTPMSLRTICKEEGMPHRDTVFSWLAARPEFADQYARARETQTHVMEDDLLDMADDGTNDWMEKLGKDGESLGWELNKEAIARSKLRIETRLRLMEQLKPKRYGKAVTLKGDADAPLVPPAIIVPMKDAIGSSVAKPQGSGDPVAGKQQTPG